MNLYNVIIITILSFIFNGCGNDKTGLLNSDRPWNLPLIERLVRELRKLFGSEVEFESASGADLIHDYCADLKETSIVAGKDHTGLADIRWAKGEDVIKCLNLLNITRQDALFTLHNLRYGVAEDYSFTAIAKDSKKSQESNHCGFGIYDVKVDLVGYLDNKIRQITDGIKQANSDHHRQDILDSKIPALQFHSELMDEFNKLNDAHTLYISPFDMFTWSLPICFDSGKIGNKQVVWLCNLHMEVVYTQLHGHGTTEGSSGDEISEIDGMPVIQWLKYMVSDSGPLKGFYSDKNQRINQAFFISDSIQLSLAYRSPPKKHYIDITFKNGNKAKVNWLVRFLDYSPSLEKYGIKDGLSWRPYNALVNLNEKFDYVLEIEHGLLHRDMASIWDVTSSSGDKEMDKAVSPIIKSLNEMRQEDLLELEVAGFLGKNRHLNDTYFTRKNTNNRSEAAAAALTRLSSTYRALWNYNGVIRWKIEGYTVIVIIPTFLIPNQGDKSSDEFLYLPVLFEIQQAAKLRNITRILIDLSANSGGYVLSSMAALWHFVDSPEDVCQPQSKHMTKHWRLWVESFASDWEGSVKAAINWAGDRLGDMSFITQKFEELKILYKYAVHIIPDFRDFSSELKWIEKTLVSLASLSWEERKEAFKRILIDREFIHGKHAKEIAPEGGGWYPFTQDELLVSGHNVTFKPSLKQYTNPDTFKWGPQYSYYSEKGDWTFCRKEVLPRMDKLKLNNKEWQRGYWRDIAILSDGGCGSACSMFAMGLHMYGKATSYTFGGIADEPMSVSAFTGGNVESYAKVWPKVNFAAHLGNWATFGKAKWSELNDLDWVNYATAFPTRATATFNWNMAFHRGLGDKALPIQWYRVPSHRHIDRWARGVTERQDIHDDIAIRDWKSDLNNPQYPLLGYCVPSHTKGLYKHFWPSTKQQRSIRSH